MKLQAIILAIILMISSTPSSAMNRFEEEIEQEYLKIMKTCAELDASTNRCNRVSTRLYEKVKAKDFSFRSSKSCK